MRCVRATNGLLVLSAIVAAPLPAQDIEGDWGGSISIIGQTLPFVVHFSQSGDTLRATIDIQGVSDLPLQNVSYQPPTVRFELLAGAGLAVWEGDQSGDSIAGTFAQAGYTGRFTMSRRAPTPPDTTSVPYRQEDVYFTNGDVRLAGTLTVPEADGPFPAVVMITGSGPQNRDEQLFPDYKPFRVIADHLTRHGIAVLRYDDRGVGGSTGNVMTSTSADFAQDVLAAVDWLAARPEIDARHIGTIGHSEGGIVGPLAASQSDKIAFVVLLAGPALTGEEILYLQGEAIIRAGGGSDEDVALQRALQEQMFRAIRTDEGWDSVRALLRQQIEQSMADIPEEQRAELPNQEDLATQRIAAAVQNVQTPWFRFFIDYDPLPTLTRLRIPILAIFGEHDLQVPAQINYDVMGDALAAAGHPDYTLRIIPGVNHLFVPSETGSPAEYATQDKTFPPEFLDLITEWILART